jgi:hypothetical protein
MGVRKAAAEFIARRWLKGAEQGKEGEDVKSVLDWLKSHKRETSGAVAALVAYLAYTGKTQAAGWLLSVATFLAGGGYLESDAFHKGE